MATFSIFWTDPLMCIIALTRNRLSFPVPLSRPHGRTSIQPSARKHFRHTYASSPETTEQISLQSALKDLDQYLKSGSLEDEAAALDLVQSLQENGQFVGYAAARRVPKRSYSLSDLRMHKIDAAKLLAPEDNTLSRLKTAAALAYIAGLSAGVLGELFNVTTATGIAIVTGLLIGLDQVMAILPLHTDPSMLCVSSIFQPVYRKRVALHEAGHFLVAYVSGLLPKSYTLSALDYFQKHRGFNIQAGTTFCDSEFQQEIQNGQLKASSLDRVTCVAVAGVVAEYLNFGHSEGGLNDILQLDQLMRSLKFSQKKVDSELRWAVLNTFSLLRRHHKLHVQLADYMKEDHSVVECIQLIEQKLKAVDDI